MAINVVEITQLTDDLGFTKWTWIPLLSKEVLNTVNSIAYTEIPDNLVPASKFQIAAETSTCSLIAPWGGFADPFTEFLLGGGTQGTLLGALNGLNIVAQSFLQKQTATYALGDEYLGPQLGYCVGTLFKEKVYTEVNASNILNFNLLITSPGAENQTGSSKEQLIWRSKFERFYLNHGVIRAFQDLDRPKGKFTVIIDTKAETTSVGTIDFSNVPDTIKINRRTNGSSVTFSIDKVRGVNGGIEIDVTYAGPSIPLKFLGGDFFTLSRSWLIQDPYLLDGLMNSIKTGTLPSGNQEFFRTDQNATISEGSVTGVYIRRRNLAVGDNVIVAGLKGVIIAANEEERVVETAEVAEVVEETKTQRVVEFVDVEYETGEIIQDIPVKNVFSVGVVVEKVADSTSETDTPVVQTDFISTTVIGNVGVTTVDPDPVFDPPNDYQKEYNEYFSTGSPGVEFNTEPPIVSDPPVVTNPETPTDVLPDEDLK